MAGQEQDLRRFVGRHHHQVGSHHLLHLGSRDIHTLGIIVIVVGEHVVNVDLLVPVAAEEQHVVGGGLVLAVPGHQGGVAVKVDIGDVDFPARIGLVQAEQLVQLLEDRAHPFGRRVGERAFLREDDDLHVLFDAADDLPAFIAQGEELIRRQVKVDREPFVEDIRHHVDQDDHGDHHHRQGGSDPSVAQLADVLFDPLLPALFLFVLRVLAFRPVGDFLAGVFPGRFFGGHVLRRPGLLCGGIFRGRLLRGFLRGSGGACRLFVGGGRLGVFILRFRQGVAVPQLLPLRRIFVYQAHAPFRIGGQCAASPGPAAGTSGLLSSISCGPARGRSGTRTAPACSGKRSRKHNSGSRW